MQGVYQIRNNVDNKRYIGSSIDIGNRFEEHRKQLQQGIHYNYLLQRAWNKYGEVNFVFEVVEEVKGDREIIYEREQKYLVEGFDSSYLYNLAKVAIREASQDTYDRKSRASAKSYPSFFNLKTKVCIPAGMNLKQLCQDRDLNYDSMYGLKVGLVKYCTHDGWILDKNRELLEGVEDIYQLYYTQETKVKRSQARKKAWSDGLYGSSQYKQKLREARAGQLTNIKPYPAFYNGKTGEFIPPGDNLAELCLDKCLTYEKMRNLRAGNTLNTFDGWRLATQIEIDDYLKGRKNETSKS